MIQVTPIIYIKKSEVEEAFIKAHGPGGQKVNKTSSAVQLRFNAKKNPTISLLVFERLKALAGKLMTVDGVIIVSATRFRTQRQNRIDALERLIRLVREAAILPSTRKPTKPSQTSRKRRLDEKRRRGEQKKTRKRIR